MNIWDGLSGSRSSGSQRAPDRVDWDKVIEQVIDCQTAVNVNAASVVSSDVSITTLETRVQGVEAAALQSVGAAEVVSGMVVTEYGDGAAHKTVFTLTSVVLETVDGATPATDGAYAAIKLYVFPAGAKIDLVEFFKFDLVENNDGADGFTTTADFDIGLGSEAAIQASVFSLSGAQSDYNKTTVALVASSSTGDTDTNTTPGVTTTRDFYLNLRTVADTDHGTANGIVEVTGTIAITWTMLE